MNCNDVSGVPKADHSHVQCISEKHLGCKESLPTMKYPKGLKLYHFPASCNDLVVNSKISLTEHVPMLWVVDLLSGYSVDFKIDMGPALCLAL